MNRSGWIGSVLLVAAVIGAGASLAAWKRGAEEEAAQAASGAYEPVEAITAAEGRPREHRATVSSIGTVVALRSVTLRNEMAGTVRQASLVPGDIVEAGKVLVTLDVAVEEAELKALEAQAALAEASLARLEKAIVAKAASELELDKARAERDVARAQIVRTKAVIARKTIRAPFKARVGLSDLHPGQYLNEGTVITTLLGLDEAAYVDFSVPQAVAERLAPGEAVEVFIGDARAPTAARVAAVDARVDPNTRNAWVRAKVEGAALPPGTGARVRAPAGPARAAVSVPASALRKGPEGDHVFVLQAGPDGALRAAARRVTSGALLGDEVLIVEGLKAGERVAASGSFKLRDGAKVAVSEETAGSK